MHFAWNHLSKIACTKFMIYLVITHSQICLKDSARSGCKSIQRIAVQGLYSKPPIMARSLEHTTLQLARTMEERIAKKK